MNGILIKITLIVTLPLLMILFSANRVFAQTFTFGATGDFGNGSYFTSTVTQVKNDNPAFLIALGDFAYTPAEQSWCGVWKSNFSNILLIAGNHDSGGSDGNINTYITHCPTLNVQKTGIYGKEYYFDYPQNGPIARFILISPGVTGAAMTGINASYTTGSQGFNFVSSAIDSARAAGIKWVVVSMHKNYISAMEKSNELGPDLINMLLNKKVDLILQGHEHGYERSKQLKCAKINSYDPTCVADSDNSMVKGAGSVIHVIGTGGQGPRGLNANDSEYQYFAKLDNTTNGYGKFIVSPTSINFNFVRTARGNLTDSFTITQTGGNTPTPTGSNNIQAADVNGDRTINIIDIGIVVDSYGKTPIVNQKADINKDSKVDIIDIGMIIDRYSQSY